MSRLVFTFDFQAPSGSCPFLYVLHWRSNQPSLVPLPTTSSMPSLVPLPTTSGMPSLVPLPTTSGTRRLYLYSNHESNIYGSHTAYLYGSVAGPAGMWCIRRKITTSTSISAARTSPSIEAKSTCKITSTQVSSPTWLQHMLSALHPVAASPGFHSSQRG